MLVEQSSDKAALQAFLERRRALNAYALGDLDEPHWSRAEWFALTDRGEIQEIVLLYHGLQPPVLLALTNHSSENMAALLTELRPKLPKTVYAHLSPGLRPALAARYAFEEHGPHQIMELVEPEKAQTADGFGAERLGQADLDEMQVLYDASYPGHWFSAAMLDNGPYFGLRDGDRRLASVAGVHVFSKRYGVAALGNIVTRPELRGRGYGKRVTAALCQALFGRVETIGLNVHAENAAAIKLYADLGFKKVADYGEVSLTAE